MNEKYQLFMKVGNNDDCNHAEAELKYEDEKFCDYWCPTCEHGLRVIATYV